MPAWFLNKRVSFKLFHAGIMITPAHYLIFGETCAVVLCYQSLLPVPQCGEKALFSEGM